MERPGTPQLLPLAAASAAASTDDGGERHGLPQLLPSGHESGGGSQAGSTASLRGVAPSVYAAQQLVRVAAASQQPSSQPQSQSQSQPQSQASSIRVEEHASTATAVRHTSAVQLQPRSGSSLSGSAPPSESERRSNSGSAGSGGGGGGGGYSSGEPASPLQAAGASQPADPPQQPHGETRPAPGERRGSKVSFFSEDAPVNDASVDLGEGVMAGYRLREIYDRLDVMHRNRVTRAQLINALKADDEVRRLMHLPARIAQASPAQTDFERLFQALDAHNTRGISWEDFRDTFFGCTVTQFRPKKKPAEIPRRSFVKRPGCSFFTYEEQEQQQQQARRPEAAHPDTQPRDTQPRPRSATPTTEPDTPQEHTRDVALYNSSAPRRPEQVALVPVSVPVREVSASNSAASLARSISADSQPQLLQKVSNPSSADEVVIRAAAPAHVAAAQRPQTSEEAYIQAPTHRRSAAENQAVELRPSAHQQQEQRQQQQQQQRPLQQAQSVPLQQQQQAQPLQQMQSAPQQAEKERWQKQQQLQPPELTARRSHASARPTPSQAQQGAPPSNAPSSSKASHPQTQQQQQQQQQQPAPASQVPPQQSVEPLLRSAHEVPEPEMRPQPQRQQHQHQHQPLQQAQSAPLQQHEDQQQQQQPQMRSQPAQWQDHASASQHQQYQTQPLPPQPQQPWLRPVESNDTAGASTTTFASPTFPPPPPATPASPPGRQRQRFSSADIELRALPTSVARPAPTPTAAHNPPFPATAAAAGAGATPPPQPLPTRSSVPSAESSGRYQQYIVVEAASSRGAAPAAAATTAPEPLAETRPGSPASGLSAVAQLSDSRQATVPTGATPPRAPRSEQVRGTQETRWCGPSSGGGGDAHRHFEVESPVGASSPPPAVPRRSSPPPLRRGAAAEEVVADAERLVEVAVRDLEYGDTRLKSGGEEEALAAYQNAFSLIVQAIDMHAALREGGGGGGGGSGMQEHLVSIRHHLVLCDTLKKRIHDCYRTLGRASEAPPLSPGLASPGLSPSRYGPQPPPPPPTEQAGAAVAAAAAASSDLRCVSPPRPPAPAPLPPPAVRCVAPVGNGGRNDAVVAVSPSPGRFHVVQTPPVALSAQGAPPPPQQQPTEGEWLSPPMRRGAARRGAGAAGAGGGYALPHAVSPRGQAVLGFSEHVTGGGGRRSIAAEDAERRRLLFDPALDTSNAGVVAAAVAAAPSPPCPRCRSTVDSAANFCQYCGAALFRR
eukprot:Rhum_TRINITY_DN11245_c0_g1::Rhum_TRINITY_DN11245_c0_g1_i2::g.43550::m.43550